MRDNKLLTQKALNKVCNLLECQPGDILEYIPDEINQIQKRLNHKLKVYRINEWYTFIKVS